MKTSRSILTLAIVGYTLAGGSATLAVPPQEPDNPGGTSSGNPSGSGGTTIPNLNPHHDAENTTICSYHGSTITNVAIANVRDYAELVVALVNGGLTSTGHRVMLGADIDTILLPASKSTSTFEACSQPGRTRIIEEPRWHKGIPMPPLEHTETCVAGKYRRLLLEDDDNDGDGN